MLGGSLGRFDGETEILDFTLGDLLGEYIGAFEIVCPLLSCNDG
jgi:hypothetical protein